MEFQVTTVPRSIGIKERFSVSERVQKSAQGFNLVGSFSLLLGMSGETENLVKEQSNAGRFSRAGDPPATVSMKTGQDSFEAM
jgi:hypothetical protein